MGSKSLKTVCKALWPTLLWHVELWCILQIPQERALCIPDLFNSIGLHYTSNISSPRDTPELLVVPSVGEICCLLGLTGETRCKGRMQALQSHRVVAVFALKIKQQIEISSIQVYKTHPSTCQREKYAFSLKSKTLLEKHGVGSALPSISGYIKKLPILCGMKRMCFCIVCSSPFPGTHQNLLLTPQCYSPEKKGTR